MKPKAVLFLWGSSPHIWLVQGHFFVCVKYNYMILLKDDLAETFSQVSFKSYLPSKNNYIFSPADYQI